MKAARKPYEILEHTADIRIRVEAEDLKTLFCRYARAVFEIIAERKNVRGQAKVDLKIEEKAGDREELLINWLNDLLSLSATRGLIFSGFRIKTLNQNYLEARISGEKIQNYRINKEIKAATYHELQITRTGNIWKAEVIFDV